MTKEATEIIKQRIEAWQRQNNQEANTLTINLRKTIRKDRRERILRMVSRDLDVRDKWLGIRMLRKGYQPIPYTLKDEKGNGFKTGNKSEDAATFLANTIWGKPAEDKQKESTTSAEHLNNSYTEPTRKIVTENQGIYEG